MSHSSAACYFLAVHSSFLIGMWLGSHPLMFILRADEDTVVKLWKVFPLMALDQDLMQYSKACL